MQTEQVLDGLLQVTDLLAADMARSLSGQGLNTTKAHVLWTLRAAGPCMQRSLSRDLGYSPRHVTTLVDELIAAGLVERSAHPDDRRAVLVALTGVGQDLVTGFETGRAALADRLFSHLDTDTRTHLTATFSDIATRLAGAIEAGEP